MWLLAMGQWGLEAFYGKFRKIAKKLVSFIDQLVKSKKQSSVHASACGHAY